MFVLPSDPFLPPIEKETEAKATWKVQCMHCKAALCIVSEDLQSDGCGSLEIRKLI